MSCRALQVAPGQRSRPAEPRSDDDKPSIAVLPFTNMSGDPEQEFFSDGITEDIITDLSKISGLFVVGRNTSFTYKGKSVQLQRVSNELGRQIPAGRQRAQGRAASARHRPADRRADAAAMSGPSATIAT